MSSLLELLELMHADAARVRREKRQSRDTIPAPRAIPREHHFSFDPECPHLAEEPASGFTPWEGK